MSDGIVLALGLGAIFAALSCGVVGLVGATGGRSASAARLAQVERMTGLPVALTAADLAFTDRVVAPSLQRMVRLARRLSPTGVAARIQRHLDLAGNPAGWTADRVFAFKGLGLLAGAGVGLLLGLGSLGGLVLWCGALAAAGFLLPDVLTWNAGLKRQEQIRRTLPDALDMLTVSVEAGLGFDAALSQVAKNTRGPLAGEFFRVLQEMQIGKPRADAFRGAAERTTVGELRTFVSALVQADKLGIPLAGVLREQSHEMRLKRRQRAEEKAQQVPVKILFPMLLFIFPALFVVVIGPGAIGIIRSMGGS